MAATKNNVSILQVNMEHSKTATAVLNKRNMGNNAYVILMQEPYIYNGKVMGLNRKGKIHEHVGPQGSRASIITSTSIDAWPLLDFWSRDLIAIRTRWPSDDVVLASGYLPGDENIFPSREMIRLINYCENNSIPLVLGCDANAHHTSWGSSNTNLRGEMFVDFLMTTNMFVVNKGHKPTFMDGMGREEVLDVTLASSNILEKVESWEVSSEASFSDHNYITFCIKMGALERHSFRNPKKADWSKFNILLDEKLDSVSTTTIENPDILEVRVREVTQCMVETFQITCPEKYLDPNRRGCSWWNLELTVLRQEFKRALRKYRYLKNDNNKNNLKTCRNCFKKALRKSKLNAWRQYTSEIASVPQSARIYKILTKDKHKSMGPIELPSGKYTGSMEESLSQLLEMHRSEIDHSRKDDDVSNVVTEEKVKLAIDSFTPFKAAGNLPILRTLERMLLFINW